MVERNAQRAGLVKRAEDGHRRASTREYGNESQKGLLSPWPVAEPGKYLEWLNRPQPKEEEEKIPYAIKTNRPYGTQEWVSKVVAQSGLESTMRNWGRPGKGT